MSPKFSHITSHSIALVGLMGVGKTTIGRRLAQNLGMPFYDSDEEIEKASRHTIKGYFRDYGETAFREGERKVIERLLANQPIILATGGGAFIPPKTRAILEANSTTIWLDADFNTIYDRVRRKNTRPLLDVSDPKAALLSLMDERYPIYAQAQIRVCAKQGTHASTVKRIIDALGEHYEHST